VTVLTTGHAASPDSLAHLISPAMRALPGPARWATAPDHRRPAAEFAGPTFQRGHQV